MLNTTLLDARDILYVIIACVILSTFFYGQANVIDALSMFVQNEARWLLIVFSHIMFVIASCMPNACN
jgi:hypothetical protein